MPEIEHVNITLRRPLNEADPGECARGRYTVTDGIVTLCDEHGVALRRGKEERLTTRKVRGARDAPVWSAAVLAGTDARTVAARLLHQKVSSERRGTDFNRRLDYPRGGFA